MYHDKYEGLIRAGVEFKTLEEANKFTPLAWFGKEITENPLGRDSRLLDISTKEFEELLRTL
ncbi:MAG TPA: hypothetical protein VJJ82_03905 [Candidatus Nanoarchaeia archaeon]|nr:hypothetical protein [Candidatus Nanoarchaeia archaeon]